MEALYRAVANTFAALVAVAAVGTVVVAGVSEATLTPRPVARDGAMPERVTVSTSVGSAALFSVSDMVPGRPVHGCTTVRYEEPTADGYVVFHAPSSNGVLAPHLQMVVEVGSGDCTDFRGTVAYTGTLSSFGDTHRDAASGLTVLTVAGQGDSAVMRLTFVLTEDAPQGKTAGAEFAWTAWEAPVPVPTDIPSHEPEPDTAVSLPPQSSVGPDVEPSVSATVPPTARPTRATPSAAAPPSPASPAAQPPDGSQDGGVLSSIATYAKQVWDAVLLVAAPAARASVLPIGLLLIVALFVLIQNRIDRSDPKLALAPITQQDREFADGRTWP